MKKTLLIVMSLFLYTGCVGKDKKNNLARTESKTKIEPKIKINIEKLDTIVGALKNREHYSSNLVLQENRNLEDYKKNVLVFSELKRQTQTIDVESIIPINDNEFGYFYSLSSPEEYPESNLDLYYEIDELMLDYADKDKGNCLFLYSNLTEFVDGEYAEYYFEAIEGIVQNNIDKFCNIIYESLSDRSKERLVDIYNKHCKSAN